jgi:hypothetical protein
MRKCDSFLAPQARAQPKAKRAKKTSKAERPEKDQPKAERGKNSF